MEFWYWFVIPIVILLIWFVAAKTTVKAPGNVLHHKFLSLGNLEGKTLAEIEQVCGEASASSFGEHGVKIYQWLASGYHIVLLFDKNDICLGVSFETDV